MVVLLLAISCHEAGHAWMSWKFGDDTAFMLGRVTLNPVAHTDPIGTLLIPILGFVFGAVGGALAGIPLIGWGKPTPVNPRNWANYKLANVRFRSRGSPQPYSRDYRLSSLRPCLKPARSILEMLQAESFSRSLSF